MFRLGNSSYKQHFSMPIPWQTCPKCGHSIKENVSLRWASPPEVNAAINSGELDPIDDGGSFTASVQCSNCNTVIQAAGDWFNDFEVEDDNGVPVQRVAPSYSPKWLSHFPELIQTSPKVPGTIRAALRRADAAFWWDLRSCATALRHVVEIFLDDQGISREGVKKSGELRFRGLEERLKEFVETFKRVSEKDAEEFKDLLGATRLIGNEATHAVEPLTAETIELVSKFIGRVLERCYTGNELLEAARRIMASHQRSR